ncbi:hypothetical protein Q5M48_03255 [Acinetobacter nosocomialis]|uniref:hypothetical protein n=1 Tax=Acinetobacter nosocomialis TaxID=106654 RepID=UPI0026E94E54|nr:hypothetical protein [Acinetobacter nosocomialis]MDO7207204.1 hypothetical protein [Acinetobacter nosocomialis]
MKLTKETADSLTTAQTPEEAYKIFAEAFSKGLGTLIADAMAEALNKNVANISSANPNIAGWEKYLTSLVVSGSFGPGYKILPTTINTFSNSKAESPAIFGGGLTVTVGGTWNF